MRETQPKIQRLEEDLLRSQRENEHLKLLVEKEKEHSYNLLGDVQSSQSQLNRATDDFDKQHNEIRNVKDDNMRLMKKIKEIEGDSDKAKKDNTYLVQRTDKELLKMQGYLGDCEKAVTEQRQVSRELETQLKASKEMLHRSETNNEQALIDNSDYRKQNQQLTMRVRELESKLEQDRKENEDLKYDNTLLYEKNVEKDEKLLVGQDQISGL